MTAPKVDDQRQSPSDKPHSTTTMKPHTKGISEAGDTDELPIIGSPDTGTEQVTKPTTKPR